MEGKRAKFLNALARWGALRCVTCGCGLGLDGDALRCERGHTFNINRKGFVNLLSRQAEGCYDATLFEARGRVLASGCYDPVAEAVCRAVPEDARRVLDAGCGEGWYLNRLLTARPELSGMGLDISRDAIHRATGHPCSALWVVGDLRSLPIADRGCDAVLDVLTPAGYGEFRRVLSPEGVLVKVYPGHEYLRQLRQAAGMPLYEEGKVEAFLREKCHVLSQERVTVTQPVSPALWADFVRMTPLLQDASPEEKQRVADCPMGAVTVDLYVTCARPR